MGRIIRAHRLAVAIAVALVATGPAFSEPREPARRAVEEIVVTAQKREQAIEDVPISMSVLDSDFLQEEGITDFRDLSIFVPNFQMQESSFLILPKIRGFTVISDNLAFEPPVGLALDGVPYTRLTYFQAALFDLERVEVLRGPQGTTFGKNTTAGLLNVVSRNPTDELQGFVDLQIGELDRRRVEAGIGGPLIEDTLQFRLSGLLDERDGFLENTTADIVPGAVERPLGRDRKAVRAKLGFPDVLGSHWVFAYERFDLETIGLGGELFRVKEPVRDVMRDYDPRTDFEIGNYVLSSEAPDRRETRIDTFVATGSYAIGSWEIATVLGHSELYTEAVTDGDISPVPAINVASIERSPTATAELRTISPSLPGLFGLARALGLPLGASDLLAGFFYQRLRIAESEFRLPIFTGPFTTLFAADAAGEGPAGPPPVVPPDASVEELTIFFDQDADTVAGFAELNWHFLEEWTLQYGMRLSGETKEGEWLTRFNTPSPPLLLAAGFREFEARRDRSEFEFQPKVVLSYQPFDEVSLFASWARGFKGGGFNSFAFGNTDEELLYDAESATQWAIDVKTRLLDDTARLNVSLFRMLATDFQVLTQIAGGPGDIATLYLVENAPEALAQGIEADATWLATESLTLIGTLGVNDTEYLDFPFADCQPGRTNSDGDNDNRCDVTGEPFPFAPKWSTTLTPLARVPLGAFGVPIDWELTGSVTGEYMDTHFLNPDLDPLKRQRKFFRLRASIGLADVVRGWSIRLNVENLTDEDVSVYQSNPAAAPNTYWSLPEPPRLVFGQLRWDF